MDACVRCSWHETGNVGVEHAAPDALRCAQRLHTLCLTLICFLLKLCLSIMPMEQCLLQSAVSPNSWRFGCEKTLSCGHHKTPTNKNCTAC